MEALAILSALPPLFEILSSTVSLVRACASQSSLAKVTKGIDVQLQLLEEILSSIDARWKARSLSSAHLTQLGPVIKELGEELASLNRLLARAATPNRELGFLGRARLAVTGFEKQLKAHLQRIENMKTLLTLKVSDGIHAKLTEDSSASRINHRLLIKGVLQPSTHDFIPTKLAGTFEWILSNPKFAHLSVEPSASIVDRVLCVYGGKGCGKTVLASSLHEDLKSQDIVTAFFSFWTQSESQKKTIQMLSTLTWQLLKKLPEDSFDEATRKIMQDLPLTSKALLEVIASILQSVNRTVFFVIDGVDESTDEWGDIGVGSLGMIEDLVTKHTNLRIIIFGREPTLREAIKRFPVLEITETLVQDDMKRLIQAELNRSANIKSEDLKNHVQTVLEKKATVMFLWVKLVFKELHRCFSSAEVKATLESLPQNLDEEFHRLFLWLTQRLGGIPGTNQPSRQMHRVRGLLAHIIGAAEPLTMDELRHAYAIAVHPEADWEEHLVDDDGIIDACGDFVQISANKIHLGHSSIAEFLTRPVHNWQSHEDIKFFRIDTVQNQQLLGTTCLNYLQIVNWGYPLHDDAFIRLSQDYPLLLYAHKYTTFHVLQTPPSDWEMSAKAKQFLNSRHFRKWMEYMLLHALHDFTAAEYWIDLIQFAYWYKQACGQAEPLLELLRRRIGEEIAYRQLAYGIDDPRTQSWQSIEGLYLFWSIAQLGPGRLVEDDVPEVNLPESEPNLLVDDSNPPEVLIARAQRARGDVTSFDNPHEAIMRQLRVFTATSTQFSASSYAAVVLRAPAWLMKFNFRFDPFAALHGMVLSACARLPVLIVVIVSMMYSRLGKVKSASEICAIATRRAEGRNNFEEAAALGFMGDLWVMEENIEKGEECYHKAMIIMRTLPRSFQNQILTCSVTVPLIHVLAFMGRDRESLDLCEQIFKRISESQGSTQVGNAWERHVRGTTVWAQYRMFVLSDLAKFYLEMGYPKEALEVSERAIESLQPVLGPRNKSTISMLTQQARIFSQLRDYPNAAKT